MITSDYEKNIRKAVKTFMTAWKSNNVDNIYKSLTKTYQDGYTLTTLKVMFHKDYVPTKYRLKSISRRTDVVCDVKVMITYNETERLVGVRLLKEIAPYKPHLDGEWGVNPISMKEA